MRTLVFGCALAGLGTLVLASGAEPFRQGEPGYVGGETCAACHSEIAESYRDVGMARTLEPVGEARPLEDWAAPPFFHEASNQYFVMRRRDGGFYQRRYLLDRDGREIHSFEMEIDFTIGSGHKERDYIARLPGGELVQLPVVWYTEEESWGIAPGYDRPDHDGFSRRINYRCVFCHSAYPRLPGELTRYEAQTAFYPEDPSSIDCERCHGPGAAHVEAALAGSAAGELRAAIVNPARLPRERQMAVCLQCHLETTSAPLPNSVVKAGRGVFSFRPGESLTDYAAYFDFPPGTGHEDDFNIVHQGYQLVRSACYRGSEMTCITCHDPHRKPEAPVEYFRSRCLDCHTSQGCSAAGEKRRANGDNCMACHMPERRTDDIVHVTMTDHYIRRTIEDGLLDPIAERDNRGYEGPIRFYLPESASDLYMGMALVRGAGIASGVRLLEEELARGPRSTPEPWFYLASGLARLGRPDRAIEAYRRALDLDPEYAEAHYNLGLLHLEAGRAAAALEHFERAIVIQPDRADNHVVSGVAYAQLGQRDRSRDAYLAALELDPLNTFALINMGILDLEVGDAAAAVIRFQQALAIDPAEATARQMLDRLR